MTTIFFAGPEVEFQSTTYKEDIEYWFKQKIEFFFSQAILDKS